MSFQALNWAFSQNAPSATAKFVLVSLANFANEGNESYPSIAKLSEMTNMDRKTIISGLDKLIELNLISDTGKRVGNTNQIKVYKLNSPVSGTVPNFPDNSPVFPVEQSRFSVKESQKRDMDTSVTVKETVKEPSLSRLSVSRRPATVEEAIERGKFIGWGEADVRDWYRDCEACGWTRGDGSPFDNWARQMVIARDSIRSKKAIGNGGSLSIMDLKTIIQVKEERSKAIKEKYSTEGPVSTDWADSAKKAEFFALRKEIRDLKSKIERMA